MSLDEDTIRLAFDLLGLAGAYVAVRVHQVVGLVLVFVAVIGHTYFSIKRRWRDE